MVQPLRKIPATNWFKIKPRKKLGHLGFSLVALQPAPQVATCSLVGTSPASSCGSRVPSVCHLAVLSVRRSSYYGPLIAWCSQPCGSAGTVQSVLMGCHIPWPSMAGNLELSENLKPRNFVPEARLRRSFSSATWRAGPPKAYAGPWFRDPQLRRWVRCPCHCHPTTAFVVVC